MKSFDQFYKEAYRPMDSGLPGLPGKEWDEYKKKWLEQHKIGMLKYDLYWCILENAIDGFAERNDTGERIFPVKGRTHEDHYKQKFQQIIDYLYHSSDPLLTHQQHKDIIMSHQDTPLHPVDVWENEWPPFKAVNPNLGKLDYALIPFEHERKDEFWRRGVGGSTPLKTGLTKGTMLKGVIMFDRPAYIPATGINMDHEGFGGYISGDAILDDYLDFSTTATAKGALKRL